MADELARLRERYERQTAVWQELRAQFAALPWTTVQVSPEMVALLTRTIEPLPPVRRTPRSGSGIRG